MKRWSAGYMLCVSAGCAMLVAAFLPWAKLEVPAASFGALRLGLYQPFLAVLAAGATLVAFGVARTFWAALVAMVGGLFSALVVVAIHADLYAGLAHAGAQVTQDVGHLSGFGVSALFAAGLMSGLAGIVTAIQASPPVQQ